MKQKLRSQVYKGFPGTERRYWQERYEHHLLCVCGHWRVNRLWLYTFVRVSERRADGSTLFVRAPRSPSSRQLIKLSLQGWGTAARTSTCIESNDMTQGERPRLANYLFWKVLLKFPRLYKLHHHQLPLFPLYVYSNKPAHLQGHERRVISALWPANALVFVLKFKVNPLALTPPRFFSPVIFVLSLPLLVAAVGALTPTGNVWCQDIHKGASKEW